MQEKYADSKDSYLKCFDISLTLNGEYNPTTAHYLLLAANSQSQTQ